MGVGGHQHAENRYIFMVKREHLTTFCPLERQLRKHFIVYLSTMGAAKRASLQSSF